MNEQARTERLGPAGERRRTPSVAFRPPLRALPWALAVLLAIGIVAPAMGAAPAKGGRTVLDRIAALVGQQVITEHELDQAIVPFLPLIYRIEDPRKRMEALDRRRFEVLDQLVNDVLVLEEAERLELPVTDEEVEGHIQKTMRSAGWTEEEMLANLRQLGYETLDDYRKKTREEMLKAYAFQIRVGSRVNVTQEEIDAEYRARHPGGKQEEVRARHILLRVPEVVTVARLEDLRADAERIREEIASGEITFEQAAERYSEDTGTASAGGDLGFFTRYVLDEAFTSQAFALRPGEMSDVAQTPLGLHIIQVTERRVIEIDDFTEEEILSFIRGDLTAQARERAYRLWIRELRENAFIDIRLKPLVDRPAEEALEEPTEEPAGRTVGGPSGEPAAAPDAADGE